MVVAEQEKVSLDSENSGIEQIIAEGINQPSPLLFILHEIQAKAGYVSEDAAEQVSVALNIPILEVFSFVTFHRQFKLKLKNEPEPIESRHVIRVCSGAPCHTKGAASIVDELSKLLNVQKGEVTEDKKFALLVVDCLGTCGMSPVMMINDDVYGNLTDEDLPGYLEKYK